MKKYDEEKGFVQYETLEYYDAKLEKKVENNFAANSLKEYEEITRIVLFVYFVLATTIGGFCIYLLSK